MDIKSTINLIFQSKVNACITIIVLAIIISVVLYIFDFIANFVVATDKRTIKIFGIDGDLSQKDKQKIVFAINVLQILVIFVSVLPIPTGIFYIFDSNIISIRIDENNQIIPIKKIKDDIVEIKPKDDTQININSIETQIGSVRLRQHNTSPTITSSLTPTPTPTLTTSEAINLIDSYLDAKRLILSRKYNTEAANKYTTGKLYKDLLERISKLKSSNTYYIYGLHGLKESGDIALVRNQPTIKVQVSESYGVYNNNSKESSKRYCSYFTYTFTIDEGIWKISDYSEDSNC
jgi:hypothetical protein